MSRACSLLAFHAVRTEGGLLPQDILQRVAIDDKTLPGLSPEAYHLDPGERFRDAVNRAWSRLTVAWRSFQAALAKLPEGDPAITVTRERWLLPLFDTLGYGRLPKALTFEIDGKSYPISHAYHNSPIHLLGCRVGLDAKQKGIAGAAAASPHGLVQDFLNRSDGHLWGFVSNGYVLRVLRDHHSLTQQAYVEFDLQAILEGEAFSEFLLLWLVCHQSRIEADKPEECWLEKWFQAARDEGVRAREKLRAGVVGAIEALGTGFLRQKQANKALLQKLESGDLDKQDYYRQLLRLVYRLIFLFVAEDRGALLNPTSQATAAARARYERFYSTKRLRDLADKRRGGPHEDLWQQLCLVMNKLGDGSPELGLPALGSFLWSERAIRDLNGLELANEDLLKALRALCYVEQGRARYAVSWRNMGAEELGSVYESLLELHPEIHKEAARFELKTAAGHERKTTGSYYTPTSLVDCLLDSALEPVLEEAANKPEPEKAILDLKVCDPACGSGHFLVAAARRMAMRLARVRAGGDEPSPPEVQRALRDVVGKCIYGVDLNPMAVELCKVSLWMEAIEPGRPLSFLEGHVREGNALLGATPALMAKGIPNEAFEAIDGDDKEVAKRLKKRNKKARETGQGTLFAGFAQGAPESYYGRLTIAAGRVEEDKDDDIAAVRKKEGDWDQLTLSADYKKALSLANAWCATFVWPKQKGTLEDGAITEDLWRRMEKDPAVAPPATKREVSRLAGEFAFFHWHLAFPQVFFAGDTTDESEHKTTWWSGGFDVVLGNPPWEKVKLVEKEFFAERAPEVAKAATSVARETAIEGLKSGYPELVAAFKDARRVAEGTSQLLRRTGRFPLCGKGDVNTYSVFAEHNRSLMAEHGRAGFIVPSGIATDDTTKEYFQAVVNRRQISSFYDFQSGGELFADIGHARFKFSLVTLGSAHQTEYAFGLRSTGELSDVQRRFVLTPTDIALLNPNTLTCPVFRSRRDAEITKSIYRRVPVLIREARDGSAEENAWRVRLSAMLHMSNDSHLFGTRIALERDGWTLHGNVFKKGDEQMLPLYEAKLFHHFDHRFGDYADKPAGSESTALPEVPEQRLQDPAYAVMPRYWVRTSAVEDRILPHWKRRWLFGFRDICRSTDVRTVIAGVIPRVGVGNKLPLALAIGASSPSMACCMAAGWASFVFDYAARQKIGGTTLNFFILQQLPMLSPSNYAAEARWCRQISNDGWLLPRTLELTYTAWDLEPFAKDCGYDGPPYRWDEARRFLLRCELDAAFFHLYGIARDDVDYIMETFPIVKRKDIAAHSTYRTKDTILDIYDRMQRAIDTGEPYQTLLDPRPADPRVAHPPRPVT